MERRAINEEKVSGSVLPSAGEVLDDALDILARRHEHVEGLKLGLWVAVGVDGFNYCESLSYRICHKMLWTHR